MYNNKFKGVRGMNKCIGSNQFWVPVCRFIYIYLVADDKEIIG